MKPSVLTSLAAACLVVGAPALSQQQPALARDARAAAPGCVVAGPSAGDCRALGRYSQSYRDVEGGLRDHQGAAAARREEGGSGPVRAAGEAGRIGGPPTAQAAM